MPNVVYNRQEEEENIRQRRLERLQREAEQRDLERQRELERQEEQRRIEAQAREAQTYQQPSYQQNAYDTYKKYKEEADRSMLSYQSNQSNQPDYEPMTVDKWDQHLRDAQSNATDEQKELLGRLRGAEADRGTTFGSRGAMRMQESYTSSQAADNLRKRLRDTGMTDRDIDNELAKPEAGNRSMTEQLEYSSDFLSRYSDDDNALIETYLSKKDEAEIKGSQNGERNSMMNQHRRDEAFAASQEAAEAKEQWLKQTGKTEKDFEEAVNNAQYLYDYNKNRQETEQIRANIHTGNAGRDRLNAALYTGASLATSPWRGYGAIPETIQGTKDPYAPINTYSNRFAGVNFSNAVQGGVVNRLAEIGDPEKFDRWDLAGKAYQIGTSIGESAISMGLGGMIGGPIGGQLGQTIANIATLPSFGTNAYASTLQEAQERGLTKEQAVLTAASAGAFEMLTEVYSLDHFWEIAKSKGTKAARNAIVDTLMQAGIEGSEEGASEILNLIADNIINGDQSEFNQNVQNYVSQGMSEKDAKIQASKDWGLQFGEAVLGGTISGGFMGSFGSAIGTVRDTRAAREMLQYDDYAGIAEAMDTDEANYDTSDDLQKNALQAAKDAKSLAEDLAAKKENGEKVTSAEKRKLYQLVRDTTEMSSEASEPSIEVPEYERVESIPEEYMQPSNMTGGEMVERMTAAKTADELVDVYREAQRSSDAGAQNFVEQAYKQYKGRMINAGATQAEFDQAEGRLTSREAFLAGAQGVPESNVSLTDKTREDYLKGAQQLQETKAKAAVKSSEDIKGITLTGTGDTATITKDGVSIKASEYENANPAVNNLVSKALTQTTQRAAQAYLDNYVEGAPITSYNRAFNTFHDAGALGVQSFDDVLKKNRYMQSMIPKETLQRIYDTGRADLDEMDSKAKGTIVRKGEGEVKDMRTDKSTEAAFKPILEAFAQRTGTTIVLKDDLASNINGFFERSTGEIVLNTKSNRAFGTLIHEGFGEMLEAWNPEAMKDVQDAILSYAIDTMGEERLNAIGRNYQRAYIEQQGGTALRSAMNEYVNDAIAGVFSTETGIQDFAEWLSKNRTSEQKQTILQKIADWISKLVDGLKSMLGNSRLNEAQRMTAQMAEEQAEAIRKKILDAMDVAIRNRDAAETGGRVLSRKAMQVELDVDRKSLDSFIDEAITKDGQTSFKYNQIAFKKLTEQDVSYIAQATGGLIDASGKRFAFEGGKLSHELRNHGNPAVEKGKGQISYGKENIYEIIETLLHPDIVEAVSFGDSLDRRNTVGYAKNIGDEYVVITAVGGKRNPNIVPEEMLRFSETQWKERTKNGETILEVVYGKSKKRTVDPSVVEAIKKNRVTVALNESEDSPAPTSRTLPRSPLFDDSISETEQNGKQDLSVEVDSSGAQLTPAQQEYFADSKVRDDQGRLMVMYHGTPTGGFTVFKNGLQFFTENRQYADTYQVPSASSRTSGKQAENPQTYQVYLNIKHPFDIRDAATRKIFIDQYVKGGYALGINPYVEYKDATESGLPSWEEADNLYEFLEENDLLDEYDGLIVDEGGIPMEDGTVRNRGIAYVTFNSNQIKNITNENPTGAEDIRYSVDVDVENEIKRYGIKSMNDFVGVQKAVIAQLEKEAFFEKNNDIYNPATGMHIEIGKKGIRETLGSGNRFQYMPRELKNLKVATIRSLPDIIREAYVADPNDMLVENYHVDKNNQYTYLRCDINVNGEPATVRIAVKRPAQGNKFWIHFVDLQTEKDSGDLQPGPKGTGLPKVQNPSGTDISDDAQEVKNNLVEDASSVRNFSLKVDRPVENRRDLVAVHNLTLEQLEKTLDMGGFPSPSIAIIKAGMGHSLYGDVSVLFRKETIDPKASRANRVYGGDAWTPTFPAIEYKLSEKKLSKVEDKIRSLVPAEILRSSRTGLTLDLDNATNKVNREGNIVEAYAQDDMLRYAYTLDRGIEVEIPKREARLSGSFDNGQIKDIADAFGEAAIREMVDGGSAYYDAHPETAQRVADILNENFEKKHAGRKILKGKKLYDFISFSKWDSAIRGAAAYFENGIQQEADPYALTDAVNEAIDEDAYKQWLAELFDGVVEKSGIRNGTDVFTRSGNRRSWDALHDDYSLENIVKAMNAQEAKGATGFFAQSEIQALATKNFRSVDEIRQSSDQLQALPEEEYAKIKEAHAERAAAIVEEIYDRGESNSFIARDQAYEAIADALRNASTVSGIDKILRQWGGLTIQQDTAQKIYDLAQDIGNMPTGYFEAKPRRAVYTNEIAAVVLPDTVSQELLQKLDKAGVHYETYAAGNEEARQAAVDGHEDIRFQLEVDDVWDAIMNGTDDFDDVFLDEGGNERKVNYRQESMRSMFPILEEGAAALANEKVSKTLVRKIASDLRSMYGSTYNLNTFADNLQKIFAYIQQNGVANYEDLLRVLTEVAQPVIDEAQVVVGSREDYDTFRSNLKRYRIKLNAEQKAEVKSAFDTVQNYRNAFGSNAVFRDDGIALDDIWSELCDMSMGMLDYDTSSADQPLALLDAFEALKPTAKNDYGGSNQDMAYDLALQIIERYFEAHHMQELKDKVKAENAKYRKKVQEKYNERLKKYKQQVRQKANDRVQGVRQKANDRIAELKARHRQSVLESKNRRLASVERGKVKTEAKMLMDMILKPSEKTLKYVPDVLKKPVVEFLNSIDFVSRRAEKNEQERGYASQEVKDWRNRALAMVNVLNQIQNGTSGDESLNAFAYVLDPDLANIMQKWADDHAGAAKISDMDQNALHELKQILRSVRYAIMNANKTYVNARYESVDDMARATIMGLYKREDQKARGQIGKLLYNLRSVQMLDAFSFFEEMGEAAASVMEGIREGFNIRARDMKQAQEYGRGLLKGVDVSSWTGDRAEVKTFQAVEGPIKLTISQVMSLYCLSKRPQAYNHIMKGGIKANTVKIKGKWTTQGRPVHVSEAQLKAIVDSLTPEQKRIADGFQNFMSTESSKWGNRVTQAMHGFDKFTETNYFPIKTDQNSNAASDQNIENASYRAILNMSAAKQLTPNAMNPIIIDDIFDVFTDHIVQMATYDGMALPIMDAMRWFNYKEVVKMGKGFQHYDTVQQEISRVLGKEGRQYFLNFILDMNGMGRSGYATEFSNALVSNYKGYAIGANLRVVMQQPTAYLRASAVMNPKYLAEALPSVLQAQKLSKDLRDRSMIAWWKSQGYFETAIGQTEKQIITGISTTKDKIRDVSSAAAGLADDLTWGVLYKAVQLEQRDEFKKAGKPAAGKEFEEACIKRFDYIVDHTQVVDSMMHRTQFMRSKDTGVKMLSAFMAEPSKSWNMLHRAMVKSLQEGGGKVTPESGRHIARAGTTFIMTALLTSAAAAVMDAFRSDDDDDWQQKWLDAFIDNTVDNVDPMNMLPIVKEISPYFERMIMENLFGREYTIYNTNTRMDIDGLKSAAEAVTKLADYARGDFGSKSPYGALKSEIKAFSMLTGIPAYGLLREFETVYNNMVVELTGWSKLSAKAPGKYDAIYKAIDKGDGLKDAAAKLLADTEKSTVAASITRHYKEQYLASRDPQLYNRLVAAYVAIGYDKEDAKKKIDKWN